MMMDKRERITHPYKNEPEATRNDGMKLVQMDRIKLLEVRRVIDEILEECKDDKGFG